MALAYDLAKLDVALRDLLRDTPCPVGLLDPLAAAITRLQHSPPTGRRQSAGGRGQARGLHPQPRSAPGLCREALR